MNLKLHIVPLSTHILISERWMLKVFSVFCTGCFRSPPGLPPGFSMQGNDIGVFREDGPANRRSVVVAVENPMESDGVRRASAVPASEVCANVLSKTNSPCWRRLWAFWNRLTPFFR